MHCSAQVVAVCRALANDISERYLRLDICLSVASHGGKESEPSVAALCQSMHTLLLLLAHLPRQGERSDRDLTALLAQIHAKARQAKPSAVWFHPTATRLAARRTCMHVVWCTWSVACCVNNAACCSSWRRSRALRFLSSIKTRRRTPRKTRLCPLTPHAGPQPPTRHDRGAQTQPHCQ